MNGQGGAWRRRNALADYEAHHAGPNMTPMVDVVMVILIFFMASTVIMGPEMLLGAGLEKEAAAGGEADPRFAIEQPVFEIVLGTRGGTPVVTGIGLDSAELDSLPGAARTLAADAGTAGVRLVLNPGDGVPYEAVIRAQDSLRDAGFRSIGLR